MLRKKNQKSIRNLLYIITRTIALGFYANSMRYGEFHFLRYFRTKNKIKEITLEQDFDHLQWSDVKKNISNRFRTDFCTGYRSADFFEAPRSSKLRPSEGSSLYAWTGFRALIRGSAAKSGAQGANIYTSTQT